MQPFPNLARLVAPLSDWQLQFRNFMVDVSPRSILALSGPMPWRAGFKTSLTMATRADQHTRQRGRAYKTKMGAFRTKNRDQGHVNACGGTRHTAITNAKAMKAIATMCGLCPLLAQSGHLFPLR